MSQISISKKSYLTSLRNRLKQLYEAQESGYTDINEDWINGFMAAGYHSGLVTLSELKLEHMSAYREVSKKIMSEEGEAKLAVRLTRLCKPEAGTTRRGDQWSATAQK
jgi:hypothetical protein